MTTTWIGSPNYDSNRKTIDRIIIHWIVGNLAAADAVFQKKDPGTSAHYGVENYTVHQYVKEENVAYHAGVYAMNQRSIGIEHSASPDKPATETTYKTSAQLIADICRRYSIPLDRQHILKHSEVKATQCPGTIDIDKLIRLASEILVPVVSDTVPVERDKLADFERVKDGWNQVRAKLDVEDSVKTVVDAVDELIKKEDKLEQVKKDNIQLEKDIEDLKKKIQAYEDAQKAIDEKKTEIVDTVNNVNEKVNEINTDITISKAEFQAIKDDLARIKNIMNIPEGSLERRIRGLVMAIKGR